MVAAQLGAAMVHATFLIPFSCLAAFLAGQSAASPPHRIARAILEAAGFLAVTLAVSLALINLDPPRTRFPDLATGLTAIAICLSSAYFAAALASRLARRFSPQTAKWTLRGAMAALYGLYRWMPGPLLASLNDVLSEQIAIVAALAIPLALAGFWLLRRKMS